MKNTDQIIADYLKAHAHANGEDINMTLTYSRGWFYLGNGFSLKGHPFRKNDILSMTLTLLSRPAFQPSTKIFECISCGAEVVEAVAGNIYKTSAVSGVSEDGEIEYGGATFDEGNAEFQRYACGGCGEDVEFDENERVFFQEE